MVLKFAVYLLYFIMHCITNKGESLVEKMAQLLLSPSRIWYQFWYVFAICMCNNRQENKVFFLFCILWVLCLRLRVSNIYLSSHNFQVQKYFLHISTHTFHARWKFTNFLNECEQFEMQVGTPLSLHFIQQLNTEITVLVLVVQPCQLYMPNNCL